MSFPSANIFPMDDIMAAQHRIAVENDRHKAVVLAKAMKNRYVNEVITNSETALRLLELT